MNDFEWMLTRLLDHPVYRSTVVTVASLPALQMYLLAYLCTTKVVNVRLAQVSEEGSLFILRQKNPSTILGLSVRVHTLVQSTE